MSPVMITPTVARHEGLDAKDRHMCESNAYVLREGHEEIVMENVDSLKVVGETVILKSIFGEETTVRAGLLELHLSAHRILLEPR
jgi:predicted RNA-binding protein